MREREDLEDPWLQSALACMKVLVAQYCPVLRNSRTVAHEAPLSMEFSRQEYWSGKPFPSPGDLSCSGIKFRSPALQAASLPSEPPGRPWLGSDTSLPSVSHLMSALLKISGSLGFGHQFHP